MSGYLNRVSLIGNLGADPEVRNSQSGQKIVTMSIATSERWKDRRGQMQERTEWHRVVIYNEPLGNVAETYLKKGAKVLLEGKLSTRKWQDQQGNDRYSTEIVLSPYNGILTFLDGRRNGGGGSEERGGNAAQNTGDRDRNFDDEVPF